MNASSAQRPQQNVTVTIAIQDKPVFAIRADETTAKKILSLKEAAPTSAPRPDPGVDIPKALLSLDNVPLMQQHSTSFDIIIDEGSLTHTTIRVALGDAGLDRTDFSATVRKDDLERVKKGELKITDILFGRTQIEGDASKLTTLLLKLMSQPR